MSNHRRAVRRVAAIPGVLGVGIGRRDGAPAIIAYLAGEADRRWLPDAIEGMPVIGKVVGSIVAASAEGEP